MTNSQPVVTPNALNFTPDNKHAYAYSGVMGITNTETTMIEFNTNSEYLKGKVLFSYVDNDTEDYRYRIYLNDTIVQVILQGRKDYDFMFEYAIPIIIPPFSNVKLTAQNIDNSNSRTQIASLTAEAFGMSETEYQ